VKLKKGILLAAFLKMLIPFIVVVPGIAAYVMVNDPAIMSRLGARRWKTTGLTADRALSVVITFFTCRFKRFSLAAFTPHH
jgi:SSS family solute:Na+ symporter